MTSGMLLPLGAWVSVKLPSVPVSAAVMGLPDGVPHWSHVAPWVMGASGSFGT